MIRKPYLLFVGDVATETYAKTAFGVRDWSPGDSIAQYRLDGGIDLGLPDMSPRAAFEAGARSLLIGVAPIGGRLPEAWTPALVAAIEAGLDIVSGMHQRLGDIPAIADAAARHGRVLHDVRHSARAFPIATGRKRSGLRALTVGTDCALGKKYAALALTKAMRQRGVNATFRATGQTGIMIAGEGVAIDAVVADFIAGAAETLSPDAAPDHWDLIEGQGALFHPAYAGVTLGLIHGSQPDALILCHKPGRTHIESYPDFPIPPLEEAIRRYEEAARLTNPRARCVALALNTSRLPDDEALRAAADAAAALGLPVFDPMRFGVEQAVDAVLAVGP